MLKNLLSRPERLLSVLLFLLLSAYVGWLLSMPAWPSQDGPVHLYYTRVLGALFSSEPSPFRTYFFIKHLLPPYALYYYTLLAFSHFMPLLTADRVVVCGYVISFVLGFRYAARALGANFGVTSLLASALTLNWALGMGFANFCLSLSFALWAIGLWLRTGSGAEWGRRTGFLALLVVITLTHPVPLLLVLSFCGLDLLCRFFATRKSWRVREPRELRNGFATLFVGSLCMIYVKAFTVAHPLKQRTQVPGTVSQHIVRRIKDLLIVKNVEVLYGRWWQIEVYRVCLGLILVVGVIFAVQQWRRNRAGGVWRPSDSMTVYAACLFVVIPLLPSDMSGAYYFFERLNIMLWISVLLAASGWSPGVTAVSGNRLALSAAARQITLASLGAGVFAVLFTAILLHAAERTLRPFAMRDYALAHTQLPLQGRLAMVLNGDQERKYLWAGPPWDPYYWDTVALLRRNDAIMVNAPWLDSPIIPLAETSVVPGSVLPPQLANSPLILVHRLQDTPALRSDVLAKTSVAFFSPVGQGGQHAVPPMLGPAWTCDAPVGAGYRLCIQGGAGAVAHLSGPLSGPRSGFPGIPSGKEPEDW